jgi:hypothetical protein
MYTPTCRQLKKKTRHLQGQKWRKMADVAKCWAKIFRHVTDMSSDTSMSCQNCQCWHSTNPTKRSIGPPWRVTPRILRENSVAGMRQMTLGHRYVVRCYASPVPLTRGTLGEFNVKLNKQNSNPWWVQGDKAWEIKVHLNSNKLDMLLATGRHEPVSDCHKPPRYVPYKCTYVPYDGTFGASDQGQTLDVWQGEDSQIHHPPPPSEHLGLFWREKKHQVFFSATTEQNITHVNLFHLTR